MDNDKWHEPPKWEDLPKTYECWGGSGKPNLDPAAPLLDLCVQQGVLQWRIEQPRLNCPCDGTGWISREEIDGKPPVCTCSALSRDWVGVMHAMSCDSIPCPFCPLEASP